MVCTFKDISILTGKDLGDFMKDLTFNLPSLQFWLLLDVPQELFVQDASSGGHKFHVLLVVVPY